MNRRINALSNLMKDALLVVQSAPAKVRSNDTNYPYRASSNLFYLTGLKEENAILLVDKKGTATEAILFVEPYDEKKALWLGANLGIEGAKAQCDVDAVYDVALFEEHLQKRLQTHKRLYIEFSNMKALECWRWLAKDSDNREVKVAVRYLEDAAQLIESLRLCKDADEIKQVKKALSITTAAHEAVMKALKPGMYEYEIQALYEYTFTRMGASWDAYTTIVAGGNSANTLHYINNDKILQDGEMVLIDAGCEYDYYASDITRTFPVNGTFSPPQKTLYEAVLSVQKAVIAMIKPGIKVSALREASEEMLCQALVTLGILHGDVKTLLEQKAHKRYYPHGIGHWMGLDVHDQAPYYDEEGQELLMQEGMIITIEPGLYLRADDEQVPEQYRGIGIRIEDDILVTATGYENLSKAIVKEVDEIEAFMAL